MLMFRDRYNLLLPALQVCQSCKKDKYAGLVDCPKDGAIKGIIVSDKLSNFFEFGSDRRASGGSESCAVTKAN